MLREARPPMGGLASQADPTINQVDSVYEDTNADRAVKKGVLWVRGVMGEKWTESEKSQKSIKHTEYSTKQRVRPRQRSAL